MYVQRIINSCHFWLKSVKHILLSSAQRLSIFYDINKSLINHYQGSQPHFRVWNLLHRHHSTAATPCPPWTAWPALRHSQLGNSSEIWCCFQESAFQCGKMAGRRGWVAATRPGMTQGSRSCLVPLRGLSLMPAGLLPLLRCRQEVRGSAPYSPSRGTLPRSSARAPLRLRGKGLRAHESNKDLRSSRDQYFAPSGGHVGACCVSSHFSKDWRGSRSTMLAWPRPG